MILRTRTDGPRYKVKGHLGDGTFGRVLAAKAREERGEVLQEIMDLPRGSWWLQHNDDSFDKAFSQRRKLVEVPHASFSPFALEIKF